MSQFGNFMHSLTVDVGGKCAFCEHYHNQKQFCHWLKVRMK